MKLFLTVLAALVLCVPALASADSNVPVAVNACGLYYGSNEPSAQPDGLLLRFTNNGPKTAHIVNLKASAPAIGTAEIIHEVGTFSPGVVIERRADYDRGFPLPSYRFSLLSGQPFITCSVDSVVWDDGTQWTAEAAGAVPSPAGTIATFPAAMVLQGRGTQDARLFFATGRGALSLSSACGNIATIQIAARTSQDLAVRVTPIGTGTCSFTIRDANQSTTIPVSVDP